MTQKNEPFKQTPPKSSLLTSAGNCFSSPISTTWRRPGSCRGIFASHSFSWAASSITNISSLSRPSEYNLEELEAVQNIMRDVLKQKLLIEYSSKKSGRINKSRRDFSLLRHSFLVIPSLYCQLQELILHSSSQDVARASLNPCSVMELFDNTVSKTLSQSRHSNKLFTTLNEIKEVGK